MPIVYMPSFNNYYCTIIYLVWRIYLKVHIEIFVFIQPCHLEAFT